jgi:hypothetical protein
MSIVRIRLMIQDQDRFDQRYNHRGGAPKLTLALLPPRESQRVLDNALSCKENLSPNSNPMLCYRELILLDESGNSNSVTMTGVNCCPEFPFVSV